MTSTFLKDPDATLDYAWSWAAWLADGETITDHTITAEDGITVDSSSEAAGIVTAWLSGGTDRANYTVACQITTSDGRTDERSMTIRVRER